MKLRHAFTRLITTLWIDKDFIKFQLPNRIRVWNDLDSHKGLMIGINQTDKFEGLIEFITSYIIEVTKKQPFNY